MGWLGRKTNVGALRSDIKEASRLPLDQKMQLASEIEEFIEGIRSVMQMPDHDSELKKLFQFHGANRKALASGGFSAQWAHHAFRESYLLALIKASDDPKWFEEVHTLLYGIRGPLNLVKLGSQQRQKTGQPRPKATSKVTPKATSKVTYRDDGPHDSHDELGRLQVRTFYKDNEALRFERYYENGSLYQKGSIKNAELHGPFERFDESGRAVEKGHMNMGKRCGKWWWRSEASDEWVLMKNYRPCVGPSAERSKD